MASSSKTLSMAPSPEKLRATARRVVQNPLICRDGDYTMDFDDLAAKLDDPTVKGMILCSPHNPSGRVWTQEELKTVVSLCEARDKWIIADEIHCDIVRAGVKHHPLLKLCPEYRHRIISCTAPKANLQPRRNTNVKHRDPQSRISGALEASDH